MNGKCVRLNKKYKNERELWKMFNRTKLPPAHICITWSRLDFFKRYFIESFYPFLLSCIWILCFKCNIFIMYGVASIQLNHRKFCQCYGNLFISYWSSSIMPVRTFFFVFCSIHGLSLHWLYLILFLFRDQKKWNWIKVAKFFYIEVEHSYFCWNINIVLTR